MRYSPKTMDEVRRCLGGCPGEMPVEVEDGIPVKAKSVTDLRSLSSWPPGNWVLDVPVNGELQSTAVTVEWPSYTSLDESGTREAGGRPPPDATKRGALRSISPSCQSYCSVS
jgi:hypothetical protein